MEHLAAFIIGGYGRRVIGSGIITAFLNEELGLSPVYNEDRLAKKLAWLAPRIFCWAILVQIMFVLYHPNNIGLSYIVGIAAFIGVVFGYFGGEFNLAEKRNRNWLNYILLAIRGGFIAWPVCLTLYVAQKLGLYTGGLGDWGMRVGLFLPAFYLLGLKLEGRIRLPMVSSFPNWGEFLTGGAVMAAVGASL